MLHKRTRHLSFEQNQSPYARFLRCGDCGRAMVKTKRAGYLSIWRGTLRLFAVSETCLAVQCQ